MSDEEKEIIIKTVQLWNAYLLLPQQHPDERNDVKDAIHRIQDAIAVRIARRVEPDYFVTHIITE